MKIMTFNILHGGGTRAEKIIDSVLKHDPTTVIFTEYRENKNAKYFREVLFKNGYHSFSTSSIDPKINGVAVISKEPFITTTYPFELGDQSQRAILASFKEISVLGVYFPQKKEKLHLFDFILNRYSDILGNKGLIIGDFNTGKNYLDEPTNTFHCSKEFEKLEECGLIDSWRSRNPEGKEFSWYSNLKNGFRIDHIFSTSELDAMVERIFYSHEERENGISDHSAFIVEYS
jgi:exodeoxyribonuclease-3